MKSVTARTSLQFSWHDARIAPVFRTGVSLHSHTMCSEESLETVPGYVAGIPYLGEAVRRQETHAQLDKGIPFSFKNAFWTPPLAPRQAMRVEEKQIHRKLQLAALVSLTDHDDIRAGSLLRVLDRYAKVPISTEWTIPYEGTFFHLGVHNLPPSKATSIASELAAYTAQPTPEALPELLRLLNTYPDVLLVLNHPLWDEKGIGCDNHSKILQQLLSRYGDQFHALEMNGLRPWSENREVAAIGTDINLPVVAGGDRHGREPNALLNLSRAGSFPEFVQEVRHDRISHMIFMPQYHEPLHLRMLQAMVDVVRDYPENPAGRKLWSDRIFWRNPVNGETAPVSSIWSQGAPIPVKCFLAAMRSLEWRGVRLAVRTSLALAGNQASLSKSACAISAPCQ